MTANQISALGPNLRVADFDFDLPPELIAQHPLPRRDDSRMMVVDRKTGRIRHSRFREFPDLMGSGDLLVLNNTKVFPARAWGKNGGATIEFLFIRESEPGIWEVLCRPARRVRPGDIIDFDGGFKARVAETGPEGRRLLRFDGMDLAKRLRKIGYAPLPPYIKRRREDLDVRAEDLRRYQTVFARKAGAVAAPTAGLHFTEEMLRGLESRGVDVRQITLDVGLATFQPVRAEFVVEHTMLEEWYSITSSAARAINAAKKDGRPVAAVGTTVARTLESSWENGRILSGRRATSLFIYPGFTFHAIDRLLTNFHLPQSTLLMLVSAFAGRELVLRAYHEAVKEKYRFFSYGDCMLIL